VGIVGVVSGNTTETAREKPIRHPSRYKESMGLWRRMGSKRKRLANQVPLIMAKEKMEASEHKLKYRKLFVKE
jgi:hypothetical protein